LLGVERPLRPQGPLMPPFAYRLMDVAVVTLIFSALIGG
jgi:hypothetical protein